MRREMVLKKERRRTWLETLAVVFPPGALGGRERTMVPRFETTISA